MAQPLSEGDCSSFSRPEECIVTHVHLQLDVDFAGQVLRGQVDIRASRTQAGTDKLILDTRDLKVYRVFETNTSEVLQHCLSETTPEFGSKLEVTLPSASTDNTEVCITVEYETSSKSTALQWLKPEQTAGKKHPYLFSQCEAIHARSMLPCQDTPAVKTPYTAQISVPKDLVALMSAIRKDSKPHPTDASKVVYMFEQTVPIPSYLNALVVGALESRDIGPRSKVWSEREMVDQAAYEFAETEQMLKVAEDLCGPYLWGVYDLLVLPPSFPYGGMENPCLTFVTPTLLAGDRSLVSVVVHEISHSWTGNLVSPKNWQHFWLNEGFTVFVERKINGRLRGEKMRHLNAIGGWKELKYQVEVYGAEHPYTHLVPDLVGVSPDDAFSTVPYEKGSNFLMYLEQVLGGPAVFEPFLKAYLDKYKYQSITTQDWKDYLYEYFSDKRAVLDGVAWEAWLYSPGMPPVKPQYDTSLSDACDALRARWCQCSEEPSSTDTFHASDITDMSAYQVKEFLAQLLEQPALPAKKIARMDEVYSFSGVKNSEIKFRWLRLCLRARVEAAIAPALRFVSEQGRMKFVRPIYRDLYSWEAARARAVETFRREEPSMHALTSSMVSKDLQLTS